jgi:hypothetical protein
MPRHRQLEELSEKFKLKRIEEDGSGRFDSGPEHSPTE